MGPENAGVAVACILERAGHINSAGGYLRDLTAKARQGKFSLGPMLMALLRANGFDGRGCRDTGRLTNTVGTQSARAYADPRVPSDPTQAESPAASTPERRACSKFVGRRTS